MAEDLAGQVRQDGARLHAGQPGSDGVSKRPGCRLPDTRDEQGRHDLAQAGDVHARPIPTVDHPHRGGRAGGNMPV